MCARNSARIWSVGAGELWEEFYRPGLRIIAQMPGRKPRAAILFFHGGGWFAGDPLQFLYLWPSLLAEGVACAAAEYRVMARHRSTIYESIDDARAAATHFASSFGSRPLFLAGGSAGGTLALLASGSVRVRGIILFSAVFDLSADGFKNRVTPIGGDTSISPLHLAETVRFAPTLICHGSADAVAPLASAQAFAAASNGRADLVVLDGVDHEFPRDSAYGDRILSLMRPFIDRQLGGA